MLNPLEIRRAVIHTKQTALNCRISRMRISDSRRPPATMYSERRLSQHGVVQLKGLTVRERTRALTSISQPDFRHELDDVAEN